MGIEFNTQLKELFRPISLTQLNASAAFLDRIDTKFVVSEEKFIEILHDLREHFYVLEIDGKTVFEYDSVYMDSEDYHFYNEHQKQVKSRSKVRTRKYVDSNIAFFEYKQKEGSLLRKFRYQMDVEDHGKMTGEGSKFYEGIYMSFYENQTPKEIFPSLITHCNRMTLCSKDSAERVTVDFNLKTTNLRTDKEFDFGDAVIIESKTTSLDCMSHQILKNHGVERVKGCSKYCLGLIKDGTFSDPGKFEDTLNLIDQINAK